MYHSYHNTAPETSNVFRGHAVLRVRTETYKNTTIPQTHTSLLRRKSYCIRTAFSWNCSHLLHATNCAKSTGSSERSDSGYKIQIQKTYTQIPVAAGS